MSGQTLLHVTRMCHVAHVERASRLSTRITSTVLAHDNSTRHPPVEGGNPTVSLAAVRDAQEPSRTTATVSRNRPRQAALSSCRHSRVSHRESQRPRRVVVVTSASINGTLDVTRPSNFPDKPVLAVSRYVLTTRAQLLTSARSLCV